MLVSRWLLRGLPGSLWCISLLSATVNTRAELGQINFQCKKHRANPSHCNTADSPGGTNTRDVFGPAASVSVRFHSPLPLAECLSSLVSQPGPASSRHRAGQHQRAVEKWSSSNIHTGIARDDEITGPFRLCPSSCGVQCETVPRDVENPLPLQQTPTLGFWLPSGHLSWEEPCISSPPDDDVSRLRSSLPALTCLAQSDYLSRSALLYSTVRVNKTL